ncbi:glycosyltransferase [Nostocaceae cyanobacterium CENA369]|uniref:Glycosyltransferase n=1 Tax=Dendronalium phyllosphericum CENA369 TaxID=1725256 RepID=A0A8J7LB45_9NOST|nr:glycosyltransferase [Dendronalium phyllosphericum]MBH8571522.1 glycosyltransferase [Dendronalium phyllosphericum CENA369]
MSNLKVAFAPWYTKENPYQVQLSEKLTLLGVQIKPTDCSTLYLLSTIKQSKVNILHLHWLDHFFLLRSNKLQSFIKLILFISQILILRLTNVKIIWTVHNIKNHQNKHLGLDRLGAILVSRLTHGLIVHSKAAENEIIKVFHLRQNKKIFIVPHGNYIDVYENKISQVEARKYLDIPDSSLVLLFFGLIHPYKGVLDLTKALKQLNYEDVCLVIAGKPCNEVMAQDLAQEAEDNSKIKFISGLVPDEQVQVYMNACDVVVLPYKEFLTSGAVILAMSFGKACVAPRKGCINEVLDDTGSFLYEPDNEDGLLQVLNTVVQKRDYLSKMGMHNYKLASQWNWNYVAKQTLNVYQNYLSF